MFVCGAFASVVYATSVTRSGSATVGKFEYVSVEADIESPVCVASSVFTAIPEMTKSFTQGGILANEILVTLSGEFVQTNNPSPRVRLLIDGIVQPGSMLFNRNPETVLGEENVTMNFISNPVGPGAHTATLEWGENPTGCFNSRSMIIHHR